MTKKFQLLWFLLLFFEFVQNANSQNKTTLSVLAEGNWYKVGVVKSGVYKIDYNFLKSAGIVDNSTNPQNIKIYGNGGGMLPQSNAAERVDDLRENAIYVSGEDDGLFNKNDFILFYAEGPHPIKYNKEQKTISVEQNIYSDTSYYFITADGAAGKRIESINSIEGGSPITTFDDFIYHEEEVSNILAMPIVGVESGSGREWYGEQFENKSTRVFELDVSGVDAQSPFKVFSSVLSSSPSASIFKISLNTGEIGSHSLPPIVEGAYNIKGIKDERSFETGSSTLGSSQKATLQYEFSGSGRGFLNFFVVNFKRNLTITSSSLIFRSFESLNNDISQFNISGVNANTSIWDISDKHYPKNINYTVDGNSGTFGIHTISQLKEFIVFDYLKAPAPKLFGKIANQNIHAISSADFIIITHPTFLQAANRLAEFRKNASGFQIQVVTVNSIYNEFSSGMQDVSAIRDFLKMVYDRDQKLKYVLLFGDCSYDYKNRVKNNTNFVPVYESRESLHPIRSYSSDDYFGFLEKNEGEWLEDSRGDHTVELGIGRIPCETLEEAEKIVNKITGYSNNKKNLGNWRNKVTFVADDGDANTHLYDAERLSILADTSSSYQNIKKIYLSAYPKQYGASVTSPATEEAIDDAVKQGTLIVNYTGHGSETGWSKRSILKTSQIVSWKNKDMLPLFVTATCEFGKYDNPYLKSGAELALENPRGGAIALVTTTRPVFSSTNFVLNKAFYEAAFTRIDNRLPTLGDIMILTKNNSLNGSINRNFALLGDPSLTLAYPANEVAITKINGKDLSIVNDTLKALEVVSIEGIVKDNNDHIISDFNGIIEMTVYDKSSAIKTLADEGTPSTSYINHNNVIFKGRFSVKDGKYSFAFRLPKNLNYQYGRAKISFYAYDEKNLIDAKGSVSDLIIGGSVANPPFDNTPPAIKLFLNDSTFVSGAEVNANPFMFAEISDESGINITTTSVGQDLKAVLTSDESKEIILNEYFIPQLDNYTAGKIVYPLNNLSKGKYTLTFKAWDIYNNSGEASIEFIVAEENGIKISELYNFPNPFTPSTGTTFSFTHDHPEDDLEIKLEIFTSEGKLIKSIRDVIYKSEGKISDYKWNGKGDFDRNIPTGLYIYRLEVRSLTKKNKGVRSERLVLIN